MGYIKNCDGEHCSECKDYTNQINVESYNTQISNCKIIEDMVKEFANGNTATVIDLNGDTFKEIK